MKYALVALSLGLLAGCASVAPVKQQPVVVEPTVQIPAPEFRSITIAGAKQVYQLGLQVYNSKQNPDFNQFATNIGIDYILGHKQSALQCAAKKRWPMGEGVAPPECLWELPYANDWLGCMFYQFPSDGVFSDYHFKTIGDNGSVTAWIETNKAEIGTSPEGLKFLGQLSGLADFGAKCEEIIRQQPPEGSIDT